MVFVYVDEVGVGWGGEVVMTSIFFGGRGLGGSGAFGAVGGCCDDFCGVGG